MVSDGLPEGGSGSAQRPTRVPLHRSGRRLSFERRLRLWLYLLGVPGFALCWALLWQHAVDASMQGIVLLGFVAVWAFAVSLLREEIVRPLQTLANVVAALREDDYSFRARGARRNDAMGDLALEVNSLAAMLQGQRAGALEAMALVERVMSSMQSPVLAFDPEGRLKLLNAAGERAFGLRGQTALGRSAAHLKLEALRELGDDGVVSLGQPGRWMVKRTSFRLRGVPHTLLVLSDVSAALREEERQAWERLIRVLGHEINNSLTPIKSIAGSLRGRLGALQVKDEGGDFELGLEVIESRAESLNRFLQAYRQLMGLPAPKLKAESLAALVARVARLETRVRVRVAQVADVTVQVDADQMQQALINLVRNAAEAALSPDVADDGLDRPGVFRADRGHEPARVARGHAGVLRHRVWPHAEDQQPPGTRPLDSFLQLRLRRSGRARRAARRLHGSRRRLHHQPDGLHDRGLRGHDLREARHRSE